MLEFYSRPRQRCQTVWQLLLIFLSDMSSEKLCQTNKFPNMTSDKSSYGAALNSCILVDYGAEVFTDYYDDSITFIYYKYGERLPWKNPR